jgi:ferredoxin
MIPRIRLRIPPTRLSHNRFPLNTPSVRWLTGRPPAPDDAPTIPITFVNPHPSLRGANGQSANRDEKITVNARVGETLLQTAHRFNIDLEGACEGVCACSTCHVIFLGDPQVYDSLPPPTEAEEDMLDMAFGLTSTSRLGCQIVLTEHMQGITVRVPDATRNFYVDGHVPQPH